jgi:CheY-like chemotaxis protein
VADDEEYNSKLITTILDKWKAKYEVVSNGVDAVHLLSETEYDIVLMDLRMPGISGENVTKFIRETLKKSHRELPVIGITADTSYEAKSEKGKLFNAFLIKPFSEHQLARLVSEVQIGRTSLSGHAERSESGSDRPNPGRPYPADPHGR